MFWEHKRKLDQCWQYGRNGTWGICPTHKDIAPFTPNFEYNQENMSIFLYKVVKTDDFLKILPPSPPKKKNLAPLVPPNNILMLVPAATELDLVYEE